MTNLKKRVASHKILQFLQNNKVIFFFQKKSVQSDHWRLLKKKIAKIEGVATLNIKNKRDRKEIEPLILSRVFPPKKKFPVPHTNLSLLEQKTPFAPNLQKKSGVFCQVPLAQQGKNNNTTHSLSGRENVTTFNQENTQKGDGETYIYESLHLQSKRTPQQNLCLESENVPFTNRERSLPLPVEDFSLPVEGFKMVERICDLLYAPNLILASNSLEKLVDLSHQLKQDSNLIFIGGWDGEQLINHLDSLKLLETSQDVWKEGVSCLSSGYAKPYLFLYSLLEKRKRSLIYSLKNKMQALTRSLQERRAQQIKEQERNPVF